MIFRKTFAASLVAACSLAAGLGEKPVHAETADFAAAVADNADDSTMPETQNPRCKRVNGSIVRAHPVTPEEGCTSPIGQCRAGVLRANWPLRGRSSLKLFSLDNPGNAAQSPVEPNPLTIQNFTAEFGFDLDNGDTLFGSTAGSVNLVNGAFVEMYTILGGTGSLTNASGYLLLRGELNVTSGPASNNNTGQARFTGQLCKP